MTASVALPWNGTKVHAFDCGRCVVSLLLIRIHGNYQRIIADLPCADRNVLLMLTVRKFVCSTLTCM